MYDRDMIVRVGTAIALAGQLLMPCPGELGKIVVTDRTPQFLNPQGAWAPTSTGDSPVYAMDCDRFAVVQSDAPARLAYFVSLSA